jgi:hypothetical protein
MPGAVWAVGRHPPDSSRSSKASPVSTPPNVFRHVISGSLAFAFLTRTCRAQGATFPTTLTTTALDRSSSGWFAASACTATAEGHQANRPGSSISCTAPIRRSGLLHPASFTFVFAPWDDKQSCAPAPSPRLLPGEERVRLRALAKPEQETLARASAVRVAPASRSARHGLARAQTWPSMTAGAGRPRSAESSASGSQLLPSILRVSQHRQPEVH